MKRTLLGADALKGLPLEFESYLRGAKIFDSSCSPEARVYFIDRDDGYYLKRSAQGTLSAEAKMTEYFHSKGLSAEVLSYIQDGSCDWLLTSRVSGEDCTHAQYLSEPKRLARLLGERLRFLHSLDFSDCPVQDRMSAYRLTAEKNYANGNFDSSFFGDGKAGARDIWREIEMGGDALSGRALLHGDYCLPNVMLDGWRFSGFIDLGNGGVGDRHIDLFWGAWTLNFNLHTDSYRGEFLDSYGRDAVDEEKIKLVGAYECFG